MRVPMSLALVFGLVLCAGSLHVITADISAPNFSFIGEIAAVDQENLEAQPAETGDEKVYGAPRDIKEEAAIYVFLGWLWLSILVLIYLLRLKIKECDRLDHFDYFLVKEKSKPEA